MGSTIGAPNPIAGLALHQSDFPVIASGQLSLSVGPGPAFTIAQDGEILVKEDDFVVGSIDVGLPPSMIDAVGAGRLIGAVPFPTGDVVVSFSLDPPIGVEDGPSSPNGPRAWLSENPARREARLSLELGEAAEVSLSIWDASGRLLRALGTTEMTAGTHTLRWDGHDDRDLAAQPGVYFARLRAGAHESVHRIVLTE
jgi:hypothetical protein